MRDANAQANYIFEALGGDRLSRFQPISTGLLATSTVNIPSRGCFRGTAKEFRDDVENFYSAICIPGLFGCARHPRGALRHPSPLRKAHPRRSWQIEREELRPGKGAAHAVNEAAWAAAYAKAQSPVQWLGMTSVTGPSEAWFLTRLDSFAAFEKTMPARN